MCNEGSGSLKFESFEQDFNGEIVDCFEDDFFSNLFIDPVYNEETKLVIDLKNCSEKKENINLIKSKKLGKVKEIGIKKTL